MKTIRSLAVLLCLAPALVLADETAPWVNRLEIAGFATGYAPRDNDTYDGGFGMEAQTRYWLTPWLGAGLAVGGAAYAVDEQDVQVREPGLSIDTEIEGGVALLPLGISLFLRPYEDDTFTLTFEGGVRYVAVESDVELEYYESRPGRWIYYEDTIEIDDGVVAVAAARLGMKLDPRISISAGAGWQFDLEKGDVELLGEKIGENELEALLIQAGVQVRF